MRPERRKQGQGGKAFEANGHLTPVSIYFVFFFFVIRRAYVENGCANGLHWPWISEGDNLDTAGSVGMVAEG